MSKISDPIEVALHEGIYLEYIHINPTEFGNFSTLSLHLWGREFPFSGLTNQIEDPTAPVGILEPGKILVPISSPINSERIAYVGHLSMEKIIKLQIDTAYKARSGVEYVHATVNVAKIKELAAIQAGRPSEQQKG